MVIVFSAPSGSGKTTIVRHLLKQERFNLAFSISATSREPRGFEKDDPNIDLLRYKSFYVFKSFTDQEVMSDGFEDQVIEVYKKIQPFFEIMTSFVTTDLNGESLI